jgi:hypothetical protein
MSYAIEDYYTLFIAVFAISAVISLICIRKGLLLHRKKEENDEVS